MFTPGTRCSERITLYILVTLYLVSACGFALATPYGEAPDEFAHTSYIEYIVRTGELPEIESQPYTNESWQPPLYYMLGAALVISGRFIAGSPVLNNRIAPEVQDNPYARNPNSESGFTVLLHPAIDRWPFWPYALRAFSIVSGLGVVLLTYATARLLVPPPTSAIAPLTATSFAALIPQANFIRANVTNENLADLIAAWIIWLLVLHLVRSPGSHRVLWIGIALGLGLLTKLSVAILLIPAVSVLWMRHTKSKHQPFLRELGTVALVMVAVAGWFYLYRWIVYGDPLAIAAWTDMLPGNSEWGLTDFFWLSDPFREFLWSSFWGVYGWQLIWMEDWIYGVLAALTVVAILGGAYLVLRRALTAAQWAGSSIMLGTLLLLYAMVVQASTHLISWQGRELFPALSSICVLFGLGLGGAASGRAAVQPLPIEPWRQRLAYAMIVAVTIGLFALNVYSILWLVLPLLNP